VSVNSYATVDEIRRRIPPIIETARLQELEIEPFINDAEDEVNGWIAERYTVPFSVTMIPAGIRFATRNLATYNLLRPLIIQEDPSRSDWVDSYRERAEAFLDKVAEGKISLTVSGAALAVVDPGHGGVWSSTMQYIPTASVAVDPIKQEIDPDRVEDEEDLRWPR